VGPRQGCDTVAVEADNNWWSEAGEDVED